MTGPSDYWTVPRLMNNFGPVPDQRLERKLYNDPFIWQWFHPKCSETVSGDKIWDWSYGVKVNLNHDLHLLSIKYLILNVPQSSESINMLIL